MIRILPLLLLFCCGNSPEPMVVAERTYETVHTEALSYCEAKGFDTDYYFLVDLSLHSGKPRFFVYDFTRGEVIDQNLVTHGSCDVESTNPTKWEKVRFSNNDGSHCSSKGKYRVGKRDVSSWGIGVKYWLKGLEATNSNAESRVVVLHSWSEVKDGEVYPSYSPLSWGCPAVSNAFMKKLDARLQKTEKPVLLWIVD